MIANRSRSYKLRLATLVATVVLSGCASSLEPRGEGPPTSGVKLFAPSRPVVVIPGFGNSKLWDPLEEKYVWGTPRNMVRTVYEDDLDLPAGATSAVFERDRLVPKGGFVGSRGPVNIAWRISNGLEKRGPYRRAKPAEPPREPGAIYAFGYDFRLSATENASLLDAFIDGIRARHEDPGLEVDVVAHSAGGLVAIAYAKLGTASLDRPEAWDAAAREAAAKIGRLILVAVPQEGTNESVRALTRGEKLVRRAWPPEMMATFPSIAEMLPEDRQPFVDETGSAIDADVWDPASWERLGFAIYGAEARASLSRRGVEWDSVERSFRASLERASRLRTALRRPFPAGMEITTIAGDCVPTSERVLLRSDRTLAFYPSELRPGEEELSPGLFGPGDGSIPARSATARASRGELFCKGHQGIASDPGAQDAILRALGGSSAAIGVEPLAPTPQRMETSPTR